MYRFRKLVTSKFKSSIKFLSVTCSKHAKLLVDILKNHNQPQVHYLTYYHFVLKLRLTYKSFFKD